MTRFLMNLADGVVKKIMGTDYVKVELEGLLTHCGGVKV